MQVPLQVTCLCVKCALEKQEEEMAKGRERICKNCACKRAILSKMFQTWPIEAFKELPDATQQTFWQSGTRTKCAMGLQLTTDVASHRVHKATNRKGGSYLPLSVYSTQGYTASQCERIAAQCPSLNDEELGVLTYKLTIVSIMEERIESDVKSELASLRDNTLRGRLSHYCSPMGKTSKRKRKRSDSSQSKSRSSRSSRSGSSSSSKSTAKSRQAKQRLADKKANEAKQTEAKAAKAAELAKRLKDKKDKKDEAAVAKAAKLADAIATKAAKDVLAVEAKAAKAVASAKLKQDPWHAHACACAVVQQR